MKLSDRVIETKASVTLKVNEKIDQILQGGQHVYNMTSGQLPFKPSSQFVAALNKQLNFLKSYQYSPISGMERLRKKFLEFIQERRDIDFQSIDLEIDCVISNGSKHSLYNVFGARTCFKFAYALTVTV